MIKKIKDITKDELVTGSLALLILLNIGNFINYVFQFSMARVLGPVDYGVLAVLTNIIYIFSVPTVSIQTIVSKYTTRFSMKKQYGKIKGLLDYLIKKTLFIALVLFILFFIISIFLSESLNISFWLLVLTGIFLFGSFLVPVGIGILQGMKKFKTWGITFIAGNLIKLVLAIILVLIGFKVYGAIIGFIVGTVATFLFILPFIKEVLLAKEEKEKVRIFSYESFSAFVAILIIVVMYSSDVILAKIFFPGDVVGQYAVISMIGKIIFFGTMAIGYAMFPISSEKVVSGKKTKTLIQKTSLVIFLMCAFAVFLFYFFPELIIKILFGGQYLDLQGILLYVGIAFSFLSFLNILVLYKISIDVFKLKHTFYLILFLIMQIVLLMIIPDSIQNFSITLMFCSIISFIGSLILVK